MWTCARSLLIDSGILTMNLYRSINFISVARHVVVGISLWQIQCDPRHKAGLPGACLRRLSGSTMWNIKQYFVTWIKTGEYARNYIVGKCMNGYQKMTVLGVAIIDKLQESDLSIQ